MSAGLFVQREIEILCDAIKWVRIYSETQIFIQHLRWVSKCIICCVSPLYIKTWQVIRFIVSCVIYFLTHALHFNFGAGD